MDDVKTVFGQRLTDRRKKMHLTQETMAEKLHVSRSTYTCYETGVSMPALTMLADIAGILSVTTDYLLGRTDQPQAVVSVASDEL
ncbi:MAG: helix-turn-helix transcriptional regulator, partial [Clostridia bacterium]|nr:helix-turn-helix transcriptional regulator [Clostridia bacterium]